MDIKSCYIGPTISPEQFIPEHFFLFMVRGTITGYDGSEHMALEANECCLVRKNHLARYHKQFEDGEFEKVVVVFDEKFLKGYADRLPPGQGDDPVSGAFVKLETTEGITGFIESLMPHYVGKGMIEESVQQTKREELLGLLLELHPELSDILFHFGQPEKINLEEFMNRNFKFNVRLERFAFMTGRSLSAFKRDFIQIFKMPPGKWLQTKRLEEAFFLLKKENQRPSDVYLEVGFEDFSHFSFAFKNRFGLSPSAFCRES